MLEVLGCQIGGLTWDSSTLILPKITVLLVTVIKIAIPVILVIMGMIDLSKAVMSNDEKQMKESQGKLIKRLIYGVLVLLVVSIVQIIFGTISDASGNDTDVSGCIACFITDSKNC